MLGIRKKALRRLLIIVTGAGIIGIIIYVALTGHVQNIGRFLTTSLSSSTFLGRILYVKDGVRLFLHHMAGLGYLGYSYMEPQIQTGVYSIRFIHNDVLQLALDIGLVPALLFVMTIIKSLISKRRKPLYRWAVLVISLHCIVDFDLQFTSIWFVLILMLDCFHGKEINIAEGGSGAFYKPLAGLASVAVAFMGMAMIPYYFESEQSLDILPFYTEAAREALRMDNDFESAQTRADRLLNQNKYLPEVYDVLATIAYEQGDYQSFIDNKTQSLQIQRYSIDSYNRYVRLLSQALDQAVENDDVDSQKLLCHAILWVPKQLDKVKDETDDLAYEIRDKPTFVLEQDVADYVEQVSRLQ